MNNRCLKLDAGSKKLRASDQVKKIEPILVTPTKTPGGGAVWQFKRAKAM
jgi:hypothetical protein